MANRTGTHQMSVIEKAEQAVAAFDHDDWVFDRENVGKPFEWCWQLRTEYGGTPVYIVCSDRYAKEESRNDAVAQAVADLPEIARALLAANRLNARLIEALEYINQTVNWEINPSNYTHSEVCSLNEQWINVGMEAERALVGRDALPVSGKGEDDE